MSGCFARILQICLALLGLLLVFLVVRFFAVSRSTAFPAQTAAPRLLSTAIAPPFNNASAIAGGATAVPVAAVISEEIVSSFAEICDNNNTLSKLQQAGFAASMADKKIIGWAGNIYNIEYDGEYDGEVYKVLVDMRADAIAAWQVEIWDVRRDLAILLKMNQMIAFDATIKQVVVGADTLCNPIILVDATITTVP